MIAFVLCIILCSITQCLTESELRETPRDLEPLTQGKQFWETDIDGRDSGLRSAHHVLTERTRHYWSHLFVKGKPCHLENGMQGICVKRKHCEHGGSKSGTCGRKFYVCCVSNYTCGAESSNGLSYFVNPEYPKGSKEGRLCEMVIHKTHKKICQYRVTFEKFELAGPHLGECNIDTFTVSGYNRNFRIPHLCGCNNKQHIVVPVDKVKCGTKFTIVTSGSKHLRRWRIRIVQIPCGHPLKAPSGCLQYYPRVAGTLESFNFKTQNLSEGYFNNLNYAMCIKRANNYCGATFSSSEFLVGRKRFCKCKDMGQVPLKDGGSREGCCPPVCKNDMVQFPLSKDGLPARFCGSVFNPKPHGIKPRPLKLRTTTPLIVYFRSDDHGPNPKGFNIDYQQNLCR